MGEASTVGIQRKLVSSVPCRVGTLMERAENISRLHRIHSLTNLLGTKLLYKPFSLIYFFILKHQASSKVVLVFDILFNGSILGKLFLCRKKTYLHTE